MQPWNLFRIKNDCALNCLLYLNNKFYHSNLNLIHFLSKHPILEKQGIQFNDLSFCAHHLGVDLFKLNSIKNFTYKAKKFFLLVYFDVETHNYHAVVARWQTHDRLIVHDPNQKITSLTLSELQELSALNIYQVDKAQKKFSNNLSFFKFTLNFPAWWSVTWPALLMNLSVIPLFFFWKIWYNLINNEQLIISFFIVFFINIAIFTISKLLLQNRVRQLRATLSQQLLTQFISRKMELKNSHLVKVNFTSFQSYAIDNAISYINLINSVLNSLILWIFIAIINIWFLLMWWIAIVILVSISLVFYHYRLKHFRDQKKSLLIKEKMLLFWSIANFIIIVYFGIFLWIIQFYSLNNIFLFLCLLSLITFDWQNTRSVCTYFFDNYWQKNYFPVLLFYNIVT